MMKFILLCRASSFVHAATSMVMIFHYQWIDYITQYQHQWVNDDPVCHCIINWICTPPKLMYFRPHRQVNTLFSVVKWNAPKLHLSSRLHWATRLLFVTNWTCRYIVHPSLLRMPFLFGWPPCQRSDMTLLEVSQHAYVYLYIRTIVLSVYLSNSCKPDMVLVYIFVE